MGKGRLVGIMFLPRMRYFPEKQGKGQQCGINPNLLKLDIKNRARVLILKRGHRSRVSVQIMLYRWCRGSSFGPLHRSLSLLQKACRRVCLGCCCAYMQIWFFFLLKQSWSRQLIIRVRSKVDTNGVIMNYKMSSLSLYILHACTSQTTNTIPFESFCLGATQKAISSYFGTYKYLCLFAWILYASWS